MRNMMRETLQDFISQQPSTSSASAPTTSAATPKRSKPYVIPKIQQLQSNTSILQQQLEQLYNNAGGGPIRHLKVNRRCYSCNKVGHTAIACPTAAHNIDDSSSTRSLTTSIPSINQGSFRSASHELAELARRFSHFPPIMQLVMSLAIFFKQTADNMRK
ncbi:hypothetical protein ACQ4LE_009228 [Meloidogyne hapla]